MKKKRNWRKNAAVWLLVPALLAAGCSAPEKEDGKKEDYKKIVDDFAAAILQQDQDSAAYGAALEAVDSYLENPGAQTLKETRQTVQDTVRRFEEAADACVSYDMDEAFAAMLTVWDIDTEDYQMDVDMRSADLASYIEQLGYLDTYLGYEEKSDAVREDLRYFCNYYLEEHVLMQGYGYSTINYLFAEWGEEQTAYVKQQILDRLVSFGKGGEAVWETDRKAVEQKGTVYLNRLETLIEDWGRYVGERQEELYELERQMERNPEENDTDVTQDARGGNVTQDADGAQGADGIEKAE